MKEATKGKINDNLMWFYLLMVMRTSFIFNFNVPPFMNLGNLQKLRFEARKKTRVYMKKLSWKF